MSERTRALEWAVASRPRGGVGVTGDAAVVAAAGDAFLLAVVDALGHGPQAAAAAQAAVAALQQYDGEDVLGALGRCHERLRGSRGAAVSICRYAPAEGTLAWIGVGNVEARLVQGAGPPPRPTRTLLLPPGIAGAELPTLRAEAQPVRRGDVLLLATDGVDPAFADWLDPVGPPEMLADAILARHARDRDDALVLVARLLGGER